MKLYHWSPICRHDMNRNNYTFLKLLSWMYFNRQMFYSVGFAHIFYYFCNACCESNQYVVMIMLLVVVVVVVMMMMSGRRRVYLRTVNFESVYRTPHLLLYSSISVHCHTVNSLFRLPNSMLKVLYRNLLACHFTGKEEQ